MSRLTKFFLATCCVTALGAFSVPAQEPSQTSTPKTDQPAATPTRSRRTGKARKPATRRPKAPSAATDAQTKDSPKVETTDAAAETAEKPEPEITDAAKEKVEPKDQTSTSDDAKETAKPEPSPEAVKTDPKQTLRDQIDAAETPVEKTRLRLKFVDLLLADGNKQDAINELRGISFEEHFDPQGFYNVGNALARLGDSDAAIVAYHKAIDQRKGRYSRALNNLGVVLLRQGRWDESYQALVSALRLENFRYAEASYNLGRLYIARGETDLAVREWRRALSVNPDHKAAAQAISAAGEQDRISVVSAVKPPVYKAPSASKAKPRSSDSLDAKPAKAASSTASVKPLSVDAETFDYLQRARSARDRDREEEAVTNYRRVISRMGGYFGPANLELGYSLINLKRMDDAIAALTPVAMRDGQRYPISYYHLARLYEGRGDLKQAEEHFSRAATYYRSENAQFLLDVSRVREKLGDFQGALKVLEEYLALLEQKDIRPDWSAARLAALKQRMASAGPKP